MPRRRQDPNQRMNQNYNNESEEDQAKQQDEHVEDQQNIQPMSEESGQDLQEYQEKDYKDIAELDRYEDQGVDNQDISQDYAARRRAEQQMRQRQYRQNRMRQGGEEDMDDLLDDDLDQEIRIQNKRRQMIYDNNQEDDDDVDQRRFLDPEEVKGKLHLWIKNDQTLKFINAKFRKFLRSYRGQHDYPIYVTKINEMCISNKQSLYISYTHLKQALPMIAMWVGLEPEIILPQLNKIAYKVAVNRYQSYQNIFPQVFVRIKDLPILDYIRELRFIHLGKLIKIRGVVTIRTQVFNQLKIIYFRCQACGNVKQPIYTNDPKGIRHGQCVSCQSTGPFKQVKKKTVYRNYQKITVQQSPSQVLPGRIPRSKQVILLGDNVDIAKPGQEVQITGIYKNRYYMPLNVKQGFPLFATQIEANCIQSTSEITLLKQDQYTEKKFIQMSKQKNLDLKIYGSIAPSIYGHDKIKRALTLAMFSGVPKSLQGGSHNIRGDINVLLLGDPGIAKSQFLKSVQKVFHRCIYTTGKGASAVGLTACVKKDYHTNEWKLEAGALVLADKGICLIDQFDKMNQHDRTSIHEAMEQQTISISKAGIVTTLRARCSVIAAANPVQGRYNTSLSFNQNVDLTDPILSRFDVLCVIKDQVDQQIDKDLSTFVINSHMTNHPHVQKYKLFDMIKQQKLPQQKDTRPYIEHEMLKQYIKYARQKCRPKLPDKNLDIIKQFYLKLRQQSIRSGGINIAVRHIESIVRLSEAHAKIYLRNEVTKQDIDVGIRTMLDSFIMTQKNSIAKDIRKKFSKYL